MGLDMNLYKRYYVKNWDHQTKEQKHKVTVTKGGKKTSIKPERVAHITEEIFYWRKANMIHKWFIDNCNNGEDNNGEFDVSREDLRELLKTINIVLASIELEDGKITNGYRYENGKKTPILEDGKLIKNPKVAQELLPTSDGFFFGSTDYDQYYYEDLKRTADMLTELLAEPEDGADYYYSASW